MQLTLEQRINLVALLGGQQALGLTLADLMLAWQLREKIDLTAKERETAGVREHNGLVVWTGTLDPVEVGLSAKERRCLMSALERVAPSLPGAARAWLPGLVSQLKEE